MKINEERETVIDEEQPIQYNMNFDVYSIYIKVGKNKTKLETEVEHENLEGRGVSKIKGTLKIIRNESGGGIGMVS